MPIYNTIGTPIESLYELKQRQEKHNFDTSNIPHPHLVILTKIGLLVGGSLTQEAFELTKKG